MVMSLMGNSFIVGGVALPEDAEKQNGRRDGDREDEGEDEAGHAASSARDDAAPSHAATLVATALPACICCSPWLPWIT